jgi:hypothetical protein
MQLDALLLDCIYLIDFQSETDAIPGIINGAAGEIGLM